MHRVAGLILGKGYLYMQMQLKYSKIGRSVSFWPLFLSTQMNIFPLRIPGCVWLQYQWLWWLLIRGDRNMYSAYKIRGSKIFKIIYRIISILMRKMLYLSQTGTHTSSSQSFAICATKHINHLCYSSFKSMCLPISHFKCVCPADFMAATTANNCLAIVFPHSVYTHFWLLMCGTSSYMLW